jgi:hypothetical protein
MQTTPQRRFGSRLMSQVIGRRDAIEWEELPSFADSLSSRLVVRGTRPGDEQPGSAAAAWIETLSSEFDFTPPSEPFREPLKGLHTREVHEPDIFRLFFGR